MHPLGVADRLIREVSRREEGRSPWCPHKPHPKQAEFLELDDEEALYGGAAGGGKSDALLMAALQYVHVPGYNAILFRRTFADLALPEAIMDRSHAWLSGTSAVWNGTKKQWLFPSGARLTFGYLDTEKHKYRYQSAAFQFIGFDELTQFPEGSYRYLFSRLRKNVGLDVPLRMRAASNPGGLGHDWVKERFIDNACTFVPAKLEHNPSADADSYRRQLAKLDPITRRQLEDGDWIQDASGLVYHAFTRALNVIHRPPADVTWWGLGIDFGFHDACAFVDGGWRRGDPTLYIIASHQQRGMLPDDAAEYVKGKPHKYAVMVGDSGGLGKGYTETMRQKFGLPVEAAEKVNKQGFIDLFNGALSRGEVKIVKQSNAELLKQLTSVSWNERRTKEVDGIDNHLTDASLYLWRKVVPFLQKKKVDTRSDERRAADDEARARYEKNKAHHDPKRHNRDDVIDGYGITGSEEDWIG